MKLVKPAMDFVDAVKEFSTKNTSTVAIKYTLKNQLTCLTPAQESTIGIETQKMPLYGEV